MEGIRNIAQDTRGTVTLGHYCTQQGPVLDTYFLLTVLITFLNGYLEFNLNKIYSILE